jgi:PKD repeat protein
MSWFGHPSSDHRRLLIQYITPDQAPVASFSVTPAPAGSPTAFDASASTAPSSPIAKYYWSFGDGTHATTTVPTVSHTYANAGTYTATLRLRDAAGTSTRRVFTDQTISRNGGRRAQTSQTVTISS